MRKKITLIIIGFIVILFGLATQSNALNSFTSVAYDTRYYCLQPSTTNINADRSYSTLGQFTIRGNTVTNDWTGATYTNTYNGRLGYILSLGRGVATPFWGHDWSGNAKYYTGVMKLPEQQSLWKIGSTWNNTVGIHVGVGYGIFGANVAIGSFPGKAQVVARSEAIDAESSNYAYGLTDNGVTNNTNASAITVSAFDSGGETLLRVGPFNFSYTGAFSSFTLTGNNGANIPIVSYQGYSGSTIQNISAPISGQNFYVTIRVPSGVEYIKHISFSSKERVKCVTFVIMYPTDATEQTVLRKDGGWEEDQEYSAEGDYQIYLLGNIDISKVDEVTKERLPNVGFTVQATSGVKSGQYVSVNSNGNAVYGNSPITLYTDVNGKISIKNLFMGNYKIVEVVNPNYGYYLEEDLPVEKGTATVKPGDSVVFTATNRLRLGSLKLYKEDETTHKRLPNVGFRIQFIKGINNKQYEGKYLTGKDGKNAYSDTPVTIYTDENGLIDIKDIWEGMYEVIEVENPHYGYYIDGELPKVLGTFDITAYNEISVTETNLRRWIRLSGFVWEDMLPNIKDPERNSLYSVNDGDKLVANVTVKLKDRNGNDVTFHTEDGEDLTEILTDENGYYQMWDIEIEKLPEYYIEFSYNGMSYESVPIVDLSPKKENSSKAKENNGERTTFNNNYSTITHSGTTEPIGQSLNANGNKTYNLHYDENQHYVDETGATINQVKSTLNYGSNPLYGYKGQNFPVNRVDEQYMIKATTKDAYQENGQSGYLTDFASIDEIRGTGGKEPLEEIKYINLGLYEREQPDLAVVEDIDTAKVTLNGYEHTYKYSQRFNANQESDGFNVGVKFGNEYGSASYTRTIYSSDMVYNMQPGNEGKLGVYITYKIALRNEATNLFTKINEVINYYDERYDIYNITDENGANLAYSEQGSAGNGFNKVVIETNQNIENQKQRIIYITYKLQNDAVNVVLNQDVTLDSVTEVSSYSTYSDANYSTHYAGVDKDSRPGSAIPENANNSSDDENVNTYEDDTDSAPSLILQVEEGRIIRGTVWEDNAIDELLTNTGYDKERKGDGLYANNENVVEKVKVELLTCTDDGNPGEVATLYHKNEALEEAEVYTGNDGSYEFSGIVPGKYLIRYTYGNESIIVSPDGSSTPIETVEKYKSTIYRAGDKTAADTMTNYWYRTETGEGNTRMSDAKDEVGIKSDGTRYDIIAERTEKTEEKVYTYGSITNEENPSNLQSIEANTKMFDVKLDYDINLDNISEYGAELKFIFDNIDFGIIRRPIQNVDIKKEISYVKVTLANGQILIEGDPRPGNINYVRYLPDGNIHIELDQELIQGATITIRYEIVVDNRNAEIDYNNEDYYIYGTVPTNHENWKIARISKLYDYLSNELIYDANNANNVNWTQIEIGQSLVTAGRLSQEAFEAIKQFNQVLQTDAFKDMEPGQEIRVPLEVSRILSNSSGDLTFTNDIEVNEVTGRKMEHDGDYTIPGNYEPSNEETGYDDDYVYLTITGPTGENRNYIQYIILGTIGLITLGAGIILIKKKVL